MSRVANILLYSLFLIMLVKSDQPQCCNDLLLWAESAITYNNSIYGQMYAYSGKGLNDLGLYHECEDLEKANYVIFEIKAVPAKVLGLCLPETCSIADLWQVSGYVFEALKGNSENLFNCVLEPDSIKASRRLNTFNFTQIVLPKDYVKDPNDMTASAGLMVAACVILFTLAVIGTAIEVFSEQKRSDSILGNTETTGENNILNSDPEKINVTSFAMPQEKLEKSENQSTFIKILLSFSLYSNFNSLFATKPEHKKDPLDCLNAVRVLSIGWICIWQVQAYRIQNSVLINLDAVADYYSQAGFIVISSGHYAIDTFFWLSGFLQGYLMTLQLNSHKKVNWILIVLHRFVRVLPLYMFILLFSWTMAKYMGSGPKWYNADYLMHENCYNYFWTYVLFINNFVMPDEVPECLAGASYLPNDMQFFILSIPIMYLYVRHSRIYGWTLLITCISFSIIASGTISSDEDISVDFKSLYTQSYLNDIYYKPYCRIAPYAIGLLGGFIYYAFKTSKKAEQFDPLASLIAQGLNENKVVRFVWYGLGLGILNLFIFAQYNANQPDITWTQTQDSFYYAFQRFGWGLGLNLFFLPILMGHFSFLRPFLQSNWWTPMAKLVFGVYLLHMVVGQIYFFSQPVSYYWNTMNWFTDAVFILSVSFLLVIPITLLVETPMVNLEKLIFKR